MRRCPMTGVECRTARIALGFSQRELARKAKVSPGFLWKFERGSVVSTPALVAQVEAALRGRPVVAVKPKPKPRPRCAVIIAGAGEYHDWELIGT